MRIRDRVRLAVADWLGITDLVRAIVAMRDAEAQHYRDCDRGFGSIQAARIEWKAEQKKQYSDLQHGQQEMEQKLDEVLAALGTGESSLRYRLDLIGGQLVVVIEKQTAEQASVNGVAEGIEHLINLVEPKAGRLRAGAAPVLDWDEVQRQNLQHELEENSNGQPVRR